MENYGVVSEFHRIDRNVPLALYKPDKKADNSKIAILAMHPEADYLSFDLCIELAKRGFIAAGANCGRGGLNNKLMSIKYAVDFLRKYPGVRTLVLLGHSGGGSLLSCYQYIAENGTDRFKNTERIIPFEDVDGLLPADGIMLLDNNYGIMDVLSIDPAVKSLKNGLERIPELDLFLPENGYSPDGAHYSEEFKTKFQKAQVAMYQNILNHAQEHFKKIRAGQGNYTDNDVLVIPGATNMVNGNKLFLEDISLLSRTRGMYPLLHQDGTITQETIYTVRQPRKSVRSETYRGALKTTVLDFLKAEVKIEEDFGYNDRIMWGSDWNFNPNSSRANVKGIHVPLLVEGNTGSHEFVESESIYENAASDDKSIIFLEGADHNFSPIRTPDSRFGDTLKTIADYIADWLVGGGRFAY